MNRKFINSLPKEKPLEDLEKAANKYAILDEEGKWKDGGKYNGFIAGAEWMLNHNLAIVNDNIKRAEKCLVESTGYDEYPYWDGANDMANAIRREIEGIKTE